MARRTDNDPLDTPNAADDAPGRPLEVWHFRFEQPARQTWFDLGGSFNGAVQKVSLTARDVWDELHLQQVVQEQHYDRLLIPLLRKPLGLHPEDDFAAALLAIPPHLLLEALFTAALPVSRMMTDLLALYADIDAQVGTKDNLRIRFDFDATVKGLDFDLAEFREWEERTREVIEQQLRRVWKIEPAFRIVDALCGPLGLSLMPAPNRSNWPAGGVPAPRSASADVDDIVRDVWSLRETFLLEAQLLWPQRIDYRKPLDGDDGLTEMAVMVSDFWDAAVDEACRVFVQLIEALSPGAAAAEVARVRTAVDAAMEQLPQTAITVRKPIDELLSLLSLPMWGARHDLYAAWVFAELVTAIGRERLSFHVQDGVLSFSFGGSKLATMETDRGALEIWAERRHEHPAPLGRGRTKHIQPDYSVVLADDGLAVLAVECKQYRRSALRSHALALQDYASGLPSATVILAAYGPASAKIESQVPLADRARTSVVRHLRPGESTSSADFRTAVRAALPTVREASSATSPQADRVLSRPKGGLVICELSWNEPRADLDLWLQVEVGGIDGDKHQVSFADRAYRSDAVEGLLAHDERSGPGREVAAAHGEAEIDVLVHSYSGPSPSQCDARLKIATAHGEIVVPVRAPRSGEEPRLWTGVHIAPDRITVLDRYGKNS